jgi:hypothetical protein
VRQRTNLAASIVVLVVTALLCSAAAEAFAQGRSRGRYYSKSDVNAVIKRVEDNGDRLRKYVDSDIDRTRLNDTRAEDRIWERVKAFEEATDRLRHNFDRTDRWQETRRDVEPVMREGREINRILNRVRISSRVQETWRRLRHELNTLAQIYELPTIR